MTTLSLHESRLRSATWTDLLGMGFMAVAAPVVACFIHSACVIYRGYQLYNAEIGGGFFPAGETYQRAWVWNVLALLGKCAVPALLVFLVLLPFRTNAQLYWLVWMACVLVCTWFLFSVEFAIH